MFRKSLALSGFKTSAAVCLLAVTMIAAFNSSPAAFAIGIGPTITVQPTNQTTTLGNTATFSVTATGTPTLTYQWQYLSGATWVNFGAGTGATSATMTTNATTAGYNGVQFRVVVTDGNALTTASNTVTLTVN